MKPKNATPYHALSVKTVLSELKTDGERGLDRKEAEKRLEKSGYNEIPKEKPLGRLVIFFSQFNSALIYILLVAGGLSLVLQSFIDAGVIFGAVALNIVIGFFQENKANRAIVRLKQLVEHRALVWRDGREITLDSKYIACGDIIVIKAGNRIPADARIMEAVSLQINEAALTGESLPSDKTTEPVSRGAALADRKNMVYAGTVALSGFGRAAVTAAGADTEIGRIAEMVRAAREEKTPLQKRLDGFSRFLGAVFGAVCFLIVLIGLAEGRKFMEMVNIGVAIGVAAIPEGLTVAVTVILALGMQQILKRKALVRKLIATETLGSITVICSDKTGTLTEGRMHVAHIIIGEKEFEIAAPGSRQEAAEAKAVSLALQAAMMCNDATIENPGDELSSWRVIGSPTEAALLSASIQSGLRKEELLKTEPKVGEKPFSSEEKIMISLHRRVRGRAYVLYEKGAPEKLIAKSSKFYHRGKVVVLNDEEKARLGRTCEKFTDKGLRVIGLALREFRISPEPEGWQKGKINWPDIDRNLTFIGFVAIKDPLRPEAKETISICRRAGIRPIIITGDHKLTARAIAEEVGIKAGEDNIMTGDRLDRMADAELVGLVGRIDVYARVSPHHKLRIVGALQVIGEVVAMTGDGINDSPALKAADIGISLGTGTDIAKETSDIVLLDNNFKTVVAAIFQGRVIFKNIRKVITYLMSDSFSEMILVVGSIAAGVFYREVIPLAILPAQILWLNIVNDGLPNFSLAFESGDKSIMSDKPLARREPLLGREMKAIIFGSGLARDLLLFSLFIYFWRQTVDIGYLRTLMFASLGVKSLMSIFGLRSFRTPIWRLNFFSNRYLLAAVAASAFFLALGVYLPPLQSILSTVPLGASDWLLAGAVGFISIIFIEAVKLIFRVRPGRIKN